MGVKLKRIEDQVVVITGASSGSGFATAKDGRAAGRAGGTRGPRPRRTASARVEIEGSGGRAITSWPMSRVSMTSHDRGARDEGVRGFDTWVNNAGVSIYGPIEKCPSRKHGVCSM
jgi:NADP-dependent 3-hydroxy acid dehydrogenase YdfG